MNIVVALIAIILHIAFTILALMLVYGSLELNGENVGLIFLVLGMIVIIKTPNWLAGYK